MQEKGRHTGKFSADGIGGRECVICFYKPFNCHIQTRTSDVTTYVGFIFADVSAVTYPEACKIAMIKMYLHVPRGRPRTRFFISTRFFRTRFLYVLCPVFYFSGSLCPSTLSFFINPQGVLHER